MSPFLIGNLNNPPLNNVDGSLVNTDGSSVAGIPFENTKIPNGPHTLAPPGSNVQSAAGIYPPAQKGGKINRKKINKISRKYKMKGSKRTIKRRVRKMKSRVRSRYSRRASSRRASRHIRGGAYQPPLTTPNYPAGYSQFLNNKGDLSNTYSLGGPLSAGSSALASPPPHQLVKNASVPDNLDHNTLNSYGKIGAGSGFASRGWF
jgi:hypothetical protein